MKKNIIPLAFIFSVQLLSAQYCGVSDSSQCTSPGLLTSGGFTPFNQVAPLINDSVSTTVIEVFNSDTLRFRGDTILLLDSMTIVSIINLPAGLCWSTNKPGNTFHSREDGCIKLTGVTCSLPGQYFPSVLITLYTSLGFPVTNTLVAIILRVKNSGEVAPPVDTTGFSTASIPTFIPYGPSAACFPAVISEVNNNNIIVKAFPNPFNDVTHIAVTDVNEKFGFELYDVTGRLQQSIPVVDYNQFDVRKGQLSQGVYMYRIIVANKPAAFGKLVVE